MDESLTYKYLLLIAVTFLVCLIVWLLLKNDLKNEITFVIALLILGFGLFWSSTYIKETYKVHGEKFLNEIGVTVHREDKYKETDKFTVDNNKIENKFEIEPVKISEIALGDYLKRGAKETYDLKVVLENGVTVTFVDGERILDKKVVEKTELYLIMDWEPYYVSVSKTSEGWIVEGLEFSILSSQDLLEKKIKEGH